MTTLQKFFRYKETTIALIVIGLTIILAIISDAFLTLENIIDMLKSNTVLGITALGSLVVIITGGIDVSVGALIAMVTVVTAKFMLAFGGNPLLVFLLGLGVGTGIGAVNGLLVAKIKIPSIIATLATMTVMNGALRWYTNGAWISGLPEQFTNIGDIIFFRTVSAEGVVLGIPIQLLFLLVAALITAFVLRKTMVGRGVLAMGGNPVSSSRMGFSNDNLTIFAFSFSGLMCGFAGVVYTTIMKTVDSNAFFGFEMQAIGAVVLGGAAITGGSGSVVGALLGMYLLATVNNGLVMTHVPTFWQKIVIGVIILFAVSFDVIKTKRDEQHFVKVDIEA